MRRGREEGTAGYWPIEYPQGKVSSRKTRSGLHFGKYHYHLEGQEEKSEATLMVQVRPCLDERSDRPERTGWGRSLLLEAVSSDFPAGLFGVGRVSGRGVWSLGRI